MAIEVPITTFCWFLREVVDPTGVSQLIDNPEASIDQRTAQKLGKSRTYLSRGTCRSSVAGILRRAVFQTGIEARLMSIRLRCFVLLAIFKTSKGSKREHIWNRRSKSGFGRGRQGSYEVNLIKQFHRKGVDCRKSSSFACTSTVATAVETFRGRNRCQGKTKTLLTRRKRARLVSLDDIPKH